MVLEMRLHHYVNSEGKIETGEFCDSFSMCDTFFKICLSTTKAGTCDILNYETNEYRDTNNVVFKDREYLGGGVTNPIKVNLSKNGSMVCTLYRLLYAFIVT